MGTGLGIPTPDVKESTLITSLARLAEDGDGGWGRGWGYLHQA